MLSNTKESTQKYPMRNSMTTFSTAWQSGATAFASLALHRPDFPSGATPCGARWCHTTARLCQRLSYAIKYEREHPKVPYAQQYDNLQHSLAEWCHSVRVPGTPPAGFPEWCHPMWGQVVPYDRQTVPKVVTCYQIRKRAPKSTLCATV